MCLKSPKASIFFACARMTDEAKVVKDHSFLKEKLQSKGYIIVGDFQCRGFNTNSFMKFFGGMNKGRPNAEDLKNAEAFAMNLKQNLQKT